MKQIVSKATILIFLIFKVFETQIICAQSNISNPIIAHYNFNNSLNDTSINAYNGVANTDVNDSDFDGVPSEVSFNSDRFGRCKQALQFDSYRETVELPHQLLDGVLTFAVSFWYTSTTSSSFISAATNNTVAFSDYNEYLLVINSSGVGEQ